jgi:hypothetical protein
MWGTFMGGYVHGVRVREVLVTVGLATAGLALVAAAGFVHLRRTSGGPITALLLAPLAVTVCASVAGAYPISLRLVLYLVPVIIILVVAGTLFTVAHASRRRQSIILGLLAGALLIRPGLRSAVPKFWPYHRQELGALVRYVEERGTGEPVYVFANAVPAWLYYTTDWNDPDTMRLDWYARIASAGGPAFENAPPRRHPVVQEGEGLSYEYNGRTEVVGVSTGEQWRVIVGSRWRRPDPGWELNEASRILAVANPAVWVVFSHFRGSENGLLDELEHGGLRQTESMTQIGAHVFRYSR